MTLLRFAGLFGLAGIMVPIGLVLLWLPFHYFKIGIPGARVFDKLLFMVWPTLLMTLGDVRESEASDARMRFLYSLLANAAIYLVIGVTIWLGLRKHAGFFVLAGAEIAIVWWQVLSFV